MRAFGQITSDLQFREINAAMRIMVKMVTVSMVMMVIMVVMVITVAKVIMVTKVTMVKTVIRDAMDSWS